MKEITVRIFITTYNNVPYLSKVLESLKYQSHKKFSVSILEDGNNHDLRAFLLDQLYPFQVEHFDQEDNGFRKNKIINTGLNHAEEDLIIFLDEDCIVHPNFIKEYVKNYDENTVCFGKRVNLDKTTSKQIMESKEFKIPSLFKLFKQKSTHVENGIYLPFLKPKFTESPTLLGCNMAIPMKLLKKINGFDEDFTTAGYGEDTDIQWRLQKAGAKFLKMKHQALQYHLYHERPNREDYTAIGRKLMHNKQEIGEYYCKNGMKKN